MLDQGTRDDDDEDVRKLIETIVSGCHIVCSVLPHVFGERWLTQGKTPMNTDFDGVNRVRIRTVWTLFARCKSLRKSV